VELPYAEMEKLVIQVEEAMRDAVTRDRIIIFEVWSQEGLMAFDSTPNNMEIHLKLKDESLRDRDQKEIEETIRVNF